MLGPDKLLCNGIWVSRLCPHWWGMDMMLKVRDIFYGFYPSKQVQDNMGEEVKRSETPLFGPHTQS